MSDDCGCPDPRCDCDGDGCCHGRSMARLGAAIHGLLHHGVLPETIVAQVQQKLHDIKRYGEAPDG